MYAADTPLSPENMQNQENITELLHQLSNGDAVVIDGLLPFVYDDLKKLAAGYLRRERGDHTLQPTALVHEAYLRLIRQRRVSWQNRAHFFGVASRLMRRILVDHARFHNAERRGREFERQQLDENFDKSLEPNTQLLRLDEALRDLAKIDPQKARLVELRYFGGLDFEEAAEILGVSIATAKRHWRIAKAFLYGQLYNE
jgi:RNA polymerase sigma factor (TIGR02999 family)